MKSAREIAADVRAGKQSARDVLEGHLAQIAAREPELHAFNLVLADEARAAADAVDASGDKGPLAGVPIAIKDNMCTRGIPTTCSSRILEGWKPPYDATVVERGPRRRRGDRREDEPRRVRDGFLDRELRVRADAQPARPGARARWIQRRISRGSRGGVRASRPRLRHRRVHPPARGPVRRRRPEADVRHGVALRSRRVRLVARPDRALRRDGRRCRAAPRGDLGS